VWRPRDDVMVSPVVAGSYRPNDEIPMTNDEGMIKAELTNKVASTLVRIPTLIRHSTFGLRHFLERFLDFARNDKNVM